MASDSHKGHKGSSPRPNWLTVVEDARARRDEAAELFARAEAATDRLVAAAHARLVIAVVCLGIAAVLGGVLTWMTVRGF